MELDSSADEPSGIFKLPAELRLQICEQVVSDFDPTTVKPLSAGSRQHHFPLLNACQTIRNEALPLYMEQLQRLNDEARVKQDAAADEALKFIQRARDTGLKYDYDELEKLHEIHEVLMRRHCRLGKIFAVDNGTV